MNVLFCFDTNYEQHFGAAVTSLILNNPEVQKDIYIITNQVSSDFRSKLDEFNDFPNLNFYTYEVEENSLKQLRVAAHISLATYYRLVAVNFLPKTIDKLLYLDSDLIVNGSILELYNLDISKYIVAACGGRVVTTKARLDLKSDFYFNAGVILFNFSLWREQAIADQCLQWLAENSRLAKYMDQDALNKIIDGRFLNLDRRWNSLVDLSEGTSHVSKESIIIHFVGSLKPWHSWCIAHERALYWRYLKLSPWSKARPEIPRNSKKALAAARALYHQIRKRVVS
ncbi:glycosyltransferase family 8 protein [Cyanobacteria bacterium FACHB-471]|nr:glycosyltransferase family 8 protein [Cyanobacteria bacterium FACHB-471]